MFLRRRLRPWVALAHRALRALQVRGRPDPETRREVVSLAWPIAAAMLGDTAMGLVDTRLVAPLGAAALGGVGVAITLMYLNYAIVFGLMRGVKVRAAHALGEGNAHHGVRYAEAGVAMGLALGALVWLFARDASWAFRALGLDREMVGTASRFLAARTALAPLTCAMSALVQWRQGVGDSRAPMRITLAGNVVNAALAWSLIHGRFGLPRLGVAGAGYATAVAESLCALALLAVLLRERRAQREALRDAPSRLEAAREVASLGVPTGLQFGAEVLAFTTFTAILANVGAREVAAHQIALATIRTSFLPGAAVAEATSVLVGRALGRKDVSEADRVVLEGLKLAVGFMALCGVVFAVAGDGIASLFGADATVERRVGQLLMVAAVFQVLDAVNIVLRGALRGAKDVRVVALMGIGVVWLCIPGAALLFGRWMHMGAVGGWLGFVFETALGSALFAWRWRRGAWRGLYPALTPPLRGPHAPSADVAAAAR